MDVVIDHLFQLPFAIQNMNEWFSQIFTKRKHNCTIKNLNDFSFYFFFLRFVHSCSVYQPTLVYLTLGKQTPLVWCVKFHVFLFSSCVSNENREPCTLIKHCQIPRESGLSCKYSFIMWSMYIPLYGYHPSCPVLCLLILVLLVSDRIWLCWGYLNSTACLLIQCVFKITIYFHFKKSDCTAFWRRAFLFCGHAKFLSYSKDREF